MREWMDKILVVLEKCIDIINNLPARNLRDDALEGLSREV